MIDVAPHPTEDLLKREPWRKAFTYTPWVGSEAMHEFVAGLAKDPRIQLGRARVLLDKLLPQPETERDEAKLQRAVMAYWRKQRDQ